MLKKLIITFVALLFASLFVCSIYAGQLSPSSKTTAAFQPKLVGFWQNFDNGAPNMRLSDIPSGYNVVIVAFGDIDSSTGTVSFNLESPAYNGDTATFKADIKTLQDRGVVVLLSLGGQNGSFAVTDQATEQNFENSLKTIISDYGFSGVDYDFENGLSLTNEPLLQEATKNLKDYFQQKSKDLIFTVAPETLDTWFQMYPNGKYDSLIKSGLINWVQVQLYNSGCMTGSKPDSQCYAVGTEDFAVSQADSTIQAWLKAGMTDANTKYVLGFPASISAAGSGYMDPAIIKKALVCLRTGQECATYTPTPADGYKNIGGVMTWSINWDAQNNYNFVSTLQPCVMQGQCS